ncbi:MAG: hypothetical protein ACRDMI_07000 [Streptosporangiaceae bacterium]
MTMAHAGEDPPDQPASGQIRTLRRNGLTPPTRETAYRFPAAEPAGGTALLGEAPIGTALVEAPLIEAPPGEAPPGGDDGPGTPAPWFTSLRKHPLAAHLALLAGYVITGLAVTWPRVTYLAGRLPATRDAGGYVWDFWWVARQVSHLSSPWSTRYLAAPVGSDLSYHTLMPLPGLVMTPITLAFGPSLTYNLLSILCPGLLCYVMYRAARLWLPTQLGAIAAGGFFGLSAILTWRSWYEVNLALGALFLPMALEAAVRLRRQPGRRQAIILGAVMGAAVLTDQESAVLTTIVAGLVLVPWLARHPSIARLRAAALAGLAGLIVGSPQFIVMILQAPANRSLASRPGLLDVNYVLSGAALQQLFAPSPRLADYGLTSVSRYYHDGPYSIVIATFGVMLTALALFGIAVSWRRLHARSLALFWLACALLSLGSVVWVGSHRFVPLAEVVHGVRLSMIMPFTWFVRIPGLATFREANRFTELGLVPAVLLAGAAVEWLRTHIKAGLIPILALALLETGWTGNPGTGTVPTALPALDGPIAAQHSNSIVMDLPFGIRGGLPVIGDGFSPETMVLATADGHPLADALISRIPAGTLKGIEGSPFYAAVLHAQGGHIHTTMAEFRQAAVSARQMNIGWVLVWRQDPALLRLLRLTGFRQAYEADGVLVYRPARDVVRASPATQPLATGAVRSAAADRS